MGTPVPHLFARAPAQGSGPVSGHVGPLLLTSAVLRPLLPRLSGCVIEGGLCRLWLWCWSVGEAVFLAHGGSALA